MHVPEVTALLNVAKSRNWYVILKLQADIAEIFWGISYICGTIFMHRLCYEGQCSMLWETSVLLMGKLAHPVEDHLELKNS